MSDSQPSLADDGRKIIMPFITNIEDYTKPSGQIFFKEYCFGQEAYELFIKALIGSIFHAGTVVNILTEKKVKHYIFIGIKGIMKSEFNCFNIKKKQVSGADLEKITRAFCLSLVKAGMNATILKQALEVFDITISTIDGSDINNFTIGFKSKLFLKLNNEETRRNSLKKFNSDVYKIYKQFEGKVIRQD